MFSICSFIINYLFVGETQEKGQAGRMRKEKETEGKEKNTVNKENDWEVKEKNKRKGFLGKNEWRCNWWS